MYYASASSKPIRNINIAKKKITAARGTITVTTTARIAAAAAVYLFPKESTTGPTETTT